MRLNREHRRYIGAVMFFHVWFSTKRRRWLLESSFEDAVKDAIADVATRHSIRVLECETMIDHVHILLELDHPRELSRAMNLIKGGSSYTIGKKLPEWKMDSGLAHLWQKRYGSKIVPEGAILAVRQYIRTQKDRPEKYAL